ncbi:hypothetical protein DPMN_075626, partial [Dreissena polymorpha]
MICGLSENDLTIEPRHAVVANGTRMTLSCTIPASVPEEHPDTRFWMVHNGKNLTSDPSAPAYKNNNTEAFAAFDAEIASNTDASVYTCVVATSGKWADTNRAEVNGTVLVVSVEQAPVFAEVGKDTRVACLRPPSAQLPKIIVTLNEHLSCDVDVIAETRTLQSLEEADTEIDCYITTERACLQYGNMGNAVDKGAVIKHRLDVIGFQINDTVAHEVCIAFRTSLGTSINISLALKNGTVVEHGLLNIFYGNITSKCFNRTDDVVELVFITSEGHEFRKDLSLAREISEEKNPIGLVVGIVAAAVAIVGLGLGVILCYCKKRLPCQAGSETLANINQGRAGNDSEGKRCHG